MQHHHSCLRLVVSIFCLISVLTGIDAHAAQSHAPLAPSVEPLPSITSADEITLKGRTDPNLRVIVEGGAQTVGVDADEKGRFSVRVTLKHDRTNTLEVYSQSDRRNAPSSDPTRVSIRQDDKPPRITATLDPQPNEKGWNTGSVTVRFTCTDAHGIARCPDPITVATPGEDQTIRAVAVDSAGNSETIKVRVSIDNTPPTAKISLSSPPNANGWFRSSVSVRFTCNDERNGSGIAQCPRSVDVKTGGRDVAVSGTVIDNAGNRTVVSTTVNLDRTDPTITMDESHEVTLIYSSPIHLAGHISDDLSGVATVNCGSLPASVTSMVFGCDVAIKAGKHRIKVWATDNAGNVATVHARVVLAPSLPGGDAHKVMVSADINGDGHIDVVHTNFSARDVSILLGNGDGTFGAERRVPVGECASSVALADVNHDGVLDIVTTHYATAQVAIQYGQVDGTYVAGPRIAVDDFPTAAVIADVNGDGLPDIVTAHMHNAKVQVHLAQIDGSFSSQPALLVGDGPVALAIGDVNADGRLDLVSANFLSSDVSILPGLGAGKFGPEQRVLLSTGSGPTAILIADLNADGIADLATPRTSTPTRYRSRCARATALTGLPRA
ncbi:MAG: VCBS repeat-containing protein [Betaproteobacteria bacterium]